MEDSINQRIVEYAESKGIRQVDLIVAGYAAKQTISNIWHQKSKPSCEFFEKLIAANPDLNARWLFSGVGEMIEKVDLAGAAMVDFLEKRLREKEEEIKKLSQEIGSLKAKIAE